MSDCTCNCGCAPLKTIKQGDDCYIAVTIYLNGVALAESDLVMLDLLEYCFEESNPRTVAAADAWNATLEKFLLPISQQESFLLEDGKNKLDLRVKFSNGGILGARHRRKMRVLEANSTEVI